ncbi:uncharacterized protein LOC113657144 isoform X2 [Tachysurus fulvidraco]|uniref:uncharacterized protein LOC113657144 isoform X2 n=1 Tax=Tachysurus fulvidraco TaxID=1234273 RepID=UPI001FEFC310|nr:uncharacterized protein LOC113657144 isoform X2 [Tachysurus fulvidraco]
MIVQPTLKKTKPYVLSQSLLTFTRATWHSTTKYLLPDNKNNMILYLEMVLENAGESEGSDSESINSHGKCVIDGARDELRGSLIKVHESQVLIQSLHNTTIESDNIKPRRRGACMHKSTSDITIFYYKSSILVDLEKGVPVVLNITNSNQFLKCTFINDKAVLSVECSEKEKLESIYKNDPLTWPFVFYLSRTKDDCCRFESAKYSGWFIRTESGSVCVDEKKDPDKDPEKYSFFVIRTPNTTKSK